ncbi:MAG: hypothetical protein ABIH34_02700 [Nanoarchaeota archaeon]
MIGKPEWFTRRKYGGWGIRPKTWQGYVYLAIVLIPFAIFNALFQGDTQTRMIVTGVWIAFLMLDVIHIMVALKKDEREKKIEALAERNAAWAMMLIISLGVAYQVITSSIQGVPTFDWFLVAALFGGVIAKSLTNIKLERGTI